MWITRKYEITLKKLFNQFPAVVLTGPRQVGKTSLLKRIFPEFSYVSLDLPSYALKAEQNPAEFLAEFKEPLIIDEIQYAPSIFRYLKTVIDMNKKPGRFILTGSQNFLLMQGIAESLAGRCGILNMLNLSVSEFEGSEIRFNENTYIFNGGFPELYKENDVQIDPHFWFVSYLSTYLERDVRNIMNVGSLRDFERFLRAAAIRTGNILSFTDLARDVGIAVNTAKTWISILQASGQIFLLEPYHRNLGKRLVKSPKLYICDSGLACFLMGFENWGSLIKSSAIGQIWETHIVMQIVKMFYSKGKIIPLWFWQVQQGNEIDILIEQGGRFIAVECKFAEQVDHTCLRGFDALKKFYNDQSLMYGYIASRTRSAYNLTDSIKVIPGSFIEKYLEG
jgi:predicted AAA+ superfamily ATPase